MKFEWYWCGHMEFTANLLHHVHIHKNIIFQHHIRRSEAGIFLSQLRGLPVSESSTLLLELPNLPLTCRAYAATALAHLMILAFSSFESISFNDKPDSIDISLNEKQLLWRLHFEELLARSLSLTALLFFRERLFLTDMASASCLCFSSR